MTDDNLVKEATIKLPVGHLIIVWDVLSNKLLELQKSDGFTEEEKRAIWALEDLCEKELINNKITGRPENEWNELIDRAREFVKTIPVEFLE